MTSAAVSGYNSSQILCKLPRWANKRDVVWKGWGRGRGWLSWTHYRQLRWGASICFGARRVTLRLSERSQHPPRPSQAESPATDTSINTCSKTHFRSAGNTYKSPNQYLERLTWTSGFWAGTCMFSFAAMIFPFALVFLSDMSLSSSFLLALGF